MVWRFKILISNIFHIPGHAKFALWWQTSWLSDRHNKNSNCLHDCPMIIYVQFGVNQIYSFWENWLFQFPIGSYNKTFSDSHFGFPIDKPKIKQQKTDKKPNKPTKANKEDHIRYIPNMEQFYHTCGFPSNIKFGSNCASSLRETDWND